jgi:4-hydroxythreonine-4-phosphate dehydrogenase
MLAVSMGDPGGIGPEVVVKALADRELRKSARWRIFGLARSLDQAAQVSGIEPYWWKAEHDSPVMDTTLVHDVVVHDYARHAGSGEFPARADRLAGELSFRFVDDAIGACRRPEGDPLRCAGVVTAPINKAAWALAGHGRYPGHTELFAERFKAKRSAMMFHAPMLNVILVTTHLPLMDIRNVLTIGRVFDAIDLGNDTCRKLGVARPRIAVCGLNPHAGEEGLLGDEEQRLIGPAIRLARDQGIDCRGPFPGDTIFNAAVRGDFDLVVAMYHDQGLIPVKLLARDEAVNFTVGLPSVRTSPDHGTAFDIAWKNKADPGSMRSAMRLAVRLASAGPSAEA